MNSLLFVYNAHSGSLNALLDMAHKLFSPSSYQCPLCTLTFDTFNENKQWKQFREQSKVNMEFYHIDEFEKVFPNEMFEYPVVLKQNENGLEVFLTKTELNALKSLDDLIKHLKSRFLLWQE
jgi:hypothetical protein